jgi:thioesterase domain-containing protein
LADLIEHDLPIFLLDHNHLPAEARDGSIEDMARLCVPHLLTRQPTGRFRIGGYCMGGLLAWEIAHQLRTANRDVEFVILIDSPSLNGRTAVRAAKRALRLVARLSPKTIRKKIEQSGMRAVWVVVRSRSIVWKAMRKLSRLIAESWSSQDKFGPSTVDEYRRLSNYIPRKLDTDLFCLVCDDNAKRIDFRPSNWRRWARSLQIEVVPGNHHSCITTFGGVVATEMQRIISTYNSKMVDADQEILAPAKCPGQVQMN